MRVLSSSLACRALGFAVAAWAGLVLSGCSRPVDVTAKPGESADQQVAGSAPAAIMVAAPVDLSHAEDEIAKQLPAQVAQINRRIARAQCATAKGQQICLDVRL